MGVISDALSTVVAVCMVVGLAARFVLLPWLRDKLVRPVEDVHKQVTENHHQNDQAPTLPDRIEDVHNEVRALARVMDVHMSWSESKAAQTDRQIRLIRKKLKRQTERRNLP